MNRVLVLGLARSGLAAKAALEADGIEVVVAERSVGCDNRRAPRLERRLRSQPGAREPEDEGLPHCSRKSR